MAASSHLSVSDYELSASLTVASSDMMSSSVPSRLLEMLHFLKLYSIMADVIAPTPSRAIVQESPWPTHDGGNRE